MANKFWTFISYIFHPVLMPTLGTLALLWCDPQLSDLMYMSNPWLMVLGIVFLCTGLLPIVLSWVLLKIGRISSIMQPNENDRKVLLSFTALCYILVYYCFHSIPALGQSLRVFMLGINIAIIITLIICLFTRISFHAVGVGGFLGTIIGLMNYTLTTLLVWLALAFAIVILASFARYKLKAHNAFEIYIGLIVGIAIQALVFFWALPPVIF